MPEDTVRPGKRVRCFTVRCRELDGIDRYGA
jgi:hypothetical protein